MLLSSPSVRSQSRMVDHSVKCVPLSVALMALDSAKRKADVLSRGIAEPPRKKAVVSSTLGQNRFSALLSPSSSEESDAADSPRRSSSSEAGSVENVVPPSTESSVGAEKDPPNPRDQACKLAGDGVCRLAGGVEMQVMRPPHDADSNPAHQGKLVKIDYVGFLFGKYIRGQLRKIDSDQIDFIVGRQQMITGFDSGVEGIRVGECRRIYIPWKLAYGAQGKPPKVPPKADLVFETRCVNVGADWDDDCRKGGIAQRARDARKKQRRMKKAG
mmetsp:Transcript_55279/g.147592  ORF Transcript_55279/g.147592 Transcript_55279/m.147592 type:complete len:272 (+) Transcript_55279:22-837(+)